MPLRELANVAEEVLAEVLQALARSKLSTTNLRDDDYDRANRLAQNLWELSRALDPMRRARWKRPGLPWTEIIRMQKEEGPKRPTKRDAALRRLGAATAEAMAAVNKHHFDRVHGENFEKFLTGSDHHDPDEKAMWNITIADMTPWQSWRLIRRLPHPPRPRGRPPGSGFDAADEPLVRELDERAAAGEHIGAVSIELAAKAPKGGTPENVALRLQRKRVRGMKNKSI